MSDSVTADFPPIPAATPQPVPVYEFTKKTFYDIYNPSTIYTTELIPDPNDPNKSVVAP